MGTKKHTFFIRTSPTDEGKVLVEVIFSPHAADPICANDIVSPEQVEFTKKALALGLLSEVQL